MTIMMGIKERNFSPLENISLEELVPKDHFYRRLEGALDLSFVRELVAERYAASSGRPSVDPVVFFRLQLVMFFEDIRSERQLMRVAADRLSVRWFLGYDLNEALPDHSSLTKIRERYGLEIFRRFFEKIVELCVEAGLVWGEELYFDSTKVMANAALDSLAPRWAVEAHLDELFDDEEEEEEERKKEPTTTETSPAVAALPMANNRELWAKNAPKSDWISRNGAQDRSFKSGYRPRTSDSRASKTDPDASPMTWTKAGSKKLGYQTHYLVDGGKARVILNVLVTPSEVTENRPMLDLLWSTAFRWHIQPRRVTGDAKYGTRENVAALEKVGIRAYVAIPNYFDFRDTGLFGPGHFRYDRGNDRYLCPAGQRLRLRNEDHHNRRKRYQAKPSICNACQLKAKCTTSDRGRMLYRPFDEDFYDRVRGYQGTFAYEKALRKRSVWVEPLFGEAKEWHGMRRFRLRRLEKVNIEALLIASGQNVKRVLAFGGRRPKKLAQAAALRPPSARSHKNRCAREHRSSRSSWRPTKEFFNTLDRF
jgi:transposase